MKHDKYVNKQIKQHKDMIKQSFAISSLGFHMASLSHLSPFILVHSVFTSLLHIHNNALLNITLLFILVFCNQMNSTVLR